MTCKINNKRYREGGIKSNRLLEIGDNKRWGMSRGVILAQAVVYVWGIMMTMWSRVTLRNKR